MTSIRRRSALGGPRAAAVQVGAVRAIIAAAVVARPVPAARLFGADTATARQVTWLTRMMGVRDGALGVGTFAAARGGPGVSGWLVGAGAADAADALVVVAALRQGRMRGALPGALVVGAAGSAAWHLVIAWRLRRR